jgi:hypothetical protein
VAPPGVPPLARNITLENDNGQAVLASALRYESDGLLAFGHGNFGASQTEEFDGEVPFFEANGGEFLHIDSDTLLVGQAFPPITTTEGAPVRINSAATDGNAIYVASRQSGLFRRDILTGQVERLGNLQGCTDSRVNAMAFHLGQFFAFCRRNGNGNNFGTIDFDTMVFTPIGNNSDCCTMNLLSDGNTLFGLIEDRFGVMDIQAGVLIENFSGNSLGRPRGMAVADGEFWMLSRGVAGKGSGNAYTLNTFDPDTGAATFKSFIGIEFHGLLAVPQL